MALNFSHRPVFPPHLSEENLVSPIRVANGYFIDGVSERSDGFGRPWHLNREVENAFGYGADRFDRGGSQESAPNDILDILPSDPFGMDISTTVTALTGWLEDLEVVDYGGYGRSEAGTSDGSCKLFAELNFFCNAMKLRNFPENMTNEFSWCLSEKAGVNTASQSNAVSPKHEDPPIDEGACSEEEEEGSLHGAVNFALAHLGIRDLLNVEKVCKSLRSTVHDDPLLWRSICIEFPLNDKITDDVLLGLANRAQGNLQSLTLVECSRITDDGLRRVLESNLRLNKLSVPGSTRISIEGIIRSLRAVKSMGSQGLKQLRIGGLYGMTVKQFEELKELLGTESQTQKSARKPHFYRRRGIYLPSDDDRDIDVELCPRCQNPRLVYDCPLETCQGKEDHAEEICRACSLCIARCAMCGRCIDGSEYEETFSLEFLCSACSNQVTASKSTTVVCAQPSSSHLHHG